MNSDVRDKMEIRKHLLPGLLLACAVAAWQFGSGAVQADFGLHSDEPSHFVSGVMVADFLRHPTASPMAFAGHYYLYYPKVAIGHWPPLFYLTEGIWFVLFGTSREAAMTLQGILSWLLLLTVYLTARRWAATGPALSAVAVLIFTPVFGESARLVMADSFTALLVLAAALAFAEYLRQPGWRSGQIFGLWCALALLSKGSASPLILLPVLAAAWAGRSEVLRRADFWLSAAPVVILAVPWYLFALTFSTPNRVAMVTGSMNLVAPWLEYGAALLTLAGAGIALAPRREPVAATLAALAAAFMVAPVFVRAFQEGRHLLPAAAAAAALGGAAVARLGQPTVVSALVLAAGWWSGRPFFVHAPAVARPWAEANVLPGAVLISGSASEEGALVAAVAELAPEPRFPVFRASRVLADSSWGGARYQLAFHEPAAVTARLNELGVAIVLQAAHATAPHDQLLEQATETWTHQVTGGYRIAHNPTPPKPGVYSIDLKRLGISITAERP